MKLFSQKQVTKFLSQLDLLLSPYPFWNLSHVLYGKNLQQSVPVGTKTAALKFLETCASLFTPHLDATGSPGMLFDVSSHLFEFNWIRTISCIFSCLITGKGFNIVNIPRGYCRFLDPVILESDGIKALNLLLDTLHSSYSVRGALTITSINW